MAVTRRLLAAAGVAAVAASLLVGCATRSASPPASTVTAVDPSGVSVTVTVTPGTGGVDVAVATTGFSWSAGPGPVPAGTVAGHAHLYVDGVLVTMLYQPTWYVPLSPGRYRFDVVLSTVDHRDVAVDGRPVVASLDVVWPPDP